MNLAIITLTTTACLYICFACSAIRKGKWHYLLAHPFIFIIGAIIWAFRYKTTFLGMESIVDTWIALGVLIFSFFYWIGYRMISFQKHVKLCENRFSEFMKTNSDKWNNQLIFWGIYGFCCLLCCTNLIYRIGITDNFETAFLSAYFTVRNPNPTLPIRLVGWFNAFFLGLLHVLIPLLFVWTFIKQTRINLLLYQIVVFLLVILSVLIAFGTGLRGLVVTPLFLTFILAVMMFVYGQNISRRIVFFFLPYFIVVVVSICMMPIVRTQGFSGIKLMFSGNISQIYTHFQSGWKATSYLVIPHIKEMNKKIIEKNNSEQIVKKQEQNINAHLDLLTKDQNNISKNRIDSPERAYSKEMLHKFSFASTPDVIAWSMNYYGIYANYLGISRVFTCIFSQFIPKDFFPNGKPLGPYMQVPKDNGRYKIGQNNPMGPFGEGFVFGGYTGGIISCVIWGFGIGLLSKLSIDLMELSRQNSFYCWVFGLTIINSLIGVGVTTSVQFIPKLFIGLVSSIIFFMVISFVQFICDFNEKSTTVR